jgi:hypothetical protein
VRQQGLLRSVLTRRDGEPSCVWLGEQFTAGAAALLAQQQWSRGQQPHTGAHGLQEPGKQQQRHTVLPAAATHSAPGSSNTQCSQTDRLTGLGGASQRLQQELSDNGALGTVSTGA